MRVTATDRRILALAIPALGALAVEPLYILVDTAIVGRLGTSPLAGLAIASSILAIVFAGSNFVTYGATEQVAGRLGADDPVGAANVSVQTLWLSAAVGVGAALVIGVLARPIAAAFGGSGEVLAAATTYLQISAVGIPAVLLTLGVQGVLRGASDYTTPLKVLAVSNLVNVGLELVMVNVLGMGVAGSAWSTVISQSGAAVVFAVIVVGRVSAATTYRPSWVAMRPLANAGRFLLLRVGSMLVVVSGSSAIAARIGEVTLAAHQIVMSMFSLLALVLDALAVPAHTLVAEALGQRDRPRAALISHRCFVMSMRLGVVLALAVAIGAPLIPHLFTPDPDVVAQARMGLLWLAAATLPGAAAFAYDGVLIGAGDFRFLGLVALGYTAVIAPWGFVVLRNPGLGISGVWAGIGVWMLMRALVNRRRSLHLLGRAA